MSVPDSDKGKWAIEELPKKWEWIDFNLFFFDRTSASKKVPQKEYLTIGKIPIIDQGEDFIGGYTNDDSLIYDGQLPVIIWGDHTRIIKLVNSPFVQGADGVKVLQPSQIVNKLYAYYAMKAIELPNKGYSRHFKFLKESSFPLPPLNEQRRIVDKLDRIGDRHRTARNELNHIPKLIARYKQAVLADAFRGDLTADWREKLNLKFNWELTPLGILLTAIESGKNVRCEERPPNSHEKGVVKISAVSWGEFRPKESKTFHESFEPDNKTLIKDRDFLISRANTIELVGACVIVEQSPENLYLSDKVLRLCMPEHLKTWVMNYLRSEEGRKQIENASTGNQLSMRNISQGSIKEIIIPLPPIEEQKEIVRRVEKMFEKIDMMEQEYQKAAKLCDRLEQATLAKAFRGELVPQDPDDESASVLLEQVKRERSKGKIKTKK
jgi:type I restriction enzyme S subunit